MSKIRVLEKMEIVLSGFGVIEIAENLSGEWQVDLFPRGSENNYDKIQLESNFRSHGDKHFKYLKQNKDI
jgi:hypothetical protein